MISKKVLIEIEKIMKISRNDERFSPKCTNRMDKIERKNQKKNCTSNQNPHDLMTQNRTWIIFNFRVQAVHIKSD